jgi:hypothetical protein
MPMHRGIVIRADHSGMVRPGKTRRLRAPVYRAVLAEKTFRGSLEEVMQQIDEALGSTPAVRKPLPVPSDQKSMPKLLRLAAKPTLKKTPQRAAAKPRRTKARK